MDRIGFPPRPNGLALARTALVTACAAVLVLAGVPLPF